MFCEVKENFLFCCFSLARKEWGILYIYRTFRHGKVPKRAFPCFGDAKQRFLRQFKRIIKKLFLLSRFSLTKSAAKVKKRKALTPVSATPTHMLRICVNPSFELFPSPRGDQCEQNAPTVRQLLNHGYRSETLKRRLGFTAVPCQAMANLAGRIWVRAWVRT